MYLFYSRKSGEQRLETHRTSPYGDRESTYVSGLCSRIFVRALGHENHRTCMDSARESSYVPRDSRNYVRACGIENFVRVHLAPGDSLRPILE